MDSPFSLRSIHLPEVKSGIATGAPPMAMDCSDRQAMDMRVVSAAAVSRERTLKIEQQKVLKYETQTILLSKRANRKFRESERAY